MWCPAAYLVEAHAIEHEGEVKRDNGQVGSGCEQQQICMTQGRCHAQTSFDMQEVGLHS